MQDETSIDDACRRLRRPRRITADQAMTRSGAGSVSETMSRSRADPDAMKSGSMSARPHRPMIRSGAGSFSEAMPLSRVDPAQERIDVSEAPADEAMTT